MPQMIDQSTILHELDALAACAAGVANTEIVKCFYMFTADNELNYTAAIADATTVTVNELPTTTVSILVYVNIGVVNAADTRFRLKRNVADAQEYRIGYRANVSEQRDFYTIAEIPTDENTFYVVDEDTTCASFIIIGYKIKA